MSLTHFDAQGQAHMVDVGPKTTTHRIAVATGEIQMLPATLALIESGTAKKGDVIGIARIAGIQAAKKTSDLIPLCHPLALTRVALEFEVVKADSTQASSVFCTATVETVGPTGVEMEALTAVQVALLTIYDMCKAVDRGMKITNLRLVEKSGAWFSYDSIRIGQGRENAKTFLKANPDVADKIEAQIRANSGLIAEETLYWREGLEQWQPVTTLVVRREVPNRWRKPVADLNRTPDGVTWRGFLFGLGSRGSEVLDALVALLFNGSFWS